MKRRLAALLAALQLLVCSVSAAEHNMEFPDSYDPEIWNPNLPVSYEPIKQEEPDRSFSIVLSFTGDMLLASLHGKRAAGNFLDYAAKQDPNYFLQNVRSIFEADDFTVANLENVLTDRTLTPKEKDTDPAYWFCAPTANAEILTSSG
ncbi:MAG: CapA family protein, partial [Dysosmobacter sp.]|nr:CapA family protein [Dysosmobacter sp.]